MDPEVLELVRSVYERPFRAAVVLTGGAAQVSSWLFTVPGASRRLVELQIPYDSASLAEYVGFEPEHYCSPEAAAALAARARQRATWLTSTPPECVLGIAATAALVTDRPKKGPHRCHAAVWDGTTLRTAALYLAKGRRDRVAEDELASRVVLNLLAESLGLAEQLPLALSDEDRLEWSCRTQPGPLWRLLHGSVRRITQLPGGALVEGHPVPRAVLPGSFNPLHDGHRLLAAVAEELLNTAVHFELSVTNVDKPRLSESEVRGRARQFEWYRPLELTDAPLFVQKAELFPGAVFVVGADTAERIVEPRYYPEGSNGMLTALETIRRCGCRFLVAARRRDDGSLATLETLPIPPSHADLFDAIPLERFLFDISSTALRTAGKPQVP